MKELKEKKPFAGGEKGLKTRVRPKGGGEVPMLEGCLRTIILIKALDGKKKKMEKGDKITENHRGGQKGQTWCF